MMDDDNLDEFEFDDDLDDSWDDIEDSEEDTKENSKNKKKNKEDDGKKSSTANNKSKIIKPIIALVVIGSGAYSFLPLLLTSDETKQVPVVQIDNIQPSTKDQPTIDKINKAEDDQSNNMLDMDMAVAATDNQNTDLISNTDYAMVDTAPPLYDSTNNNIDNLISIDNIGDKENNSNNNSINNDNVTENTSSPTQDLENLVEDNKDNKLSQATIDTIKDNNNNIEDIKLNQTDGVLTPMPDIIESDSELPELPPSSFYEDIANLKDQYEKDNSNIDESDILNGNDGINNDIKSSKEDNKDDIYATLLEDKLLSKTEISLNTDDSDSFDKTDKISNNDEYLDPDNTDLSDNIEQDSISLDLNNGDNDNIEEEKEYTEKNSATIKDEVTADKMDILKKEEISNKIDYKAQKIQKEKITKVKKVKKQAKPKWVIKAAQSSSAIIYDKISKDMRSIEIGDTVKGIGRVKSIKIIDGIWVITGSKGKIEQ